MGAVVVVGGDSYSMHGGSTADGDLILFFVGILINNTIYLFIGIEERGLYPIVYFYECKQFIDLIYIIHVKFIQFKFRCGLFFQVQESTHEVTMYLWVCLIKHRIRLYMQQQSKQFQFVDQRTIYEMSMVGCPESQINIQFDWVLTAFGWLLGPRSSAYPSPLSREKACYAYIFNIWDKQNYSLGTGSMHVILGHIDRISAVRYGAVF